MRISNYIDAMLSTKLFGSFLKEDLSRLFSSSGCSLKKYDRGQIVHIRNEVCKTMDIILEGKLSVQKIDEEGNILKIGVFSSSDTLGANLLFSDSNLYPMTVVSEAKTVVLHIYGDFVLRLCQISMEFTSGLLREISNKALVLSETIDTISLKTIRQRIIDFLKYEGHIQKSRVIRIGMTKKELAERLGIQRTSLSRELCKMRSDGLIEYNAKTITIKQPLEK